MSTRESYGLSEPIKATWDAGKLIKFIDQNLGHAMTCFRWYPSEPIRLACLKTLKGGFGHSEVLIDWTEMTIVDLAAVHDDDMAKRLLELYAAGVVGRAISLVTESDIPFANTSQYLMKKHPEVWELCMRLMLFLAKVGLGCPELRSSASKCLCECLAMCPEIYPTAAMRPARNFLTMTIHRLRESYSESDWHCSERVLRLVVQVGDLEYLERLNEFIRAHEHGKAGPVAKGGFAAIAFTRAGNLAILREARRMLNEKKKKQ